MKTNMLFNPHTLDIFKAALPHVAPEAQGGVNLLLKASELMETIEEVSNPPELSAMQLNEEEQDPEQLLLSIKEVCSQRENEFVDMMLNLMKAQKIYSAYQDYGSQVLHAEEIQSNHGRNPFGFAMGQGDGSGSFGLMDMLMNFLSPEQRNTFEMLNMMVSTMSSDMFNMGAGMSGQPNSVME